MDTATLAALARELGNEPGILCTGEEALRLTSFSADGDAIVRLTGRFQNADELVPRAIDESHTPNTDRTSGTSEYALGQGWLKALSVIASSGAPAHGATFVRVDLIRGRGTSARVLQTLLQGPVTGSTRLAWPGSTLRSPLEGRGNVRSVTGTNPAANTEISETVPTGARWILKVFNLVLVTDGNAANRIVDLIIDDGTTVIFQRADVVALTASSTWRLVGSSDGGAASNSSNCIWIPIPANLELLAGYRIRTSTTNRQVGDDFGAPQLLIEEFLEGA